jgi:hypothetical protein
MVTMAATHPAVEAPLGAACHHMGMNTIVMR